MGMRQDGSAEEFGEACTLGPADLALVASLQHAGKGHDLRLIQDYLDHRDRLHTVHSTWTAGRRFEERLGR
jgi:hypothetical protein